MGFDTSIFMF